MKEMARRIEERTGGIIIDRAGRWIQIPSLCCQTLLFFLLLDLNLLSNTINNHR